MLKKIKKEACSNKYTIIVFINLAIPSILGLQPFFIPSFLRLSGALLAWVADPGGDYYPDPDLTFEKEKKTLCHSLLSSNYSCSLPRINPLNHGGGGALYAPPSLAFCLLLKIILTHPYLKNS